jgi:hypothetical protein
LIGCANQRYFGELIQQANIWTALTNGMAADRPAPVSRPALKVKTTMRESFW